MQIFARKNIADACLSEKIEVIVGNALDIIPNLNQKFQLMFLDAARSEKEYADIYSRI